MNIKEAVRDLPSIDLSRPDNSQYDRGRSYLAWALWYFVGAPIVRSYFLPFSFLKTMLLRAFGAHVGTGVYFKPGIRIKFPWYLSIGDHCWIGEDVWIDNLADVQIGSHVCVSQGAYLCTGNHDWASVNMKLFRSPIALEDGSWIGAFAKVCPGLVIGKAAILTVGSVATKSIPPRQIWAGNPARYLRDRLIAPQAIAES